MQTIEVPNWDGFEQGLARIRDAEVSAGNTVDFLFRGISDSTRQLATTLERRGNRGVRISDYYARIFRIKPQIESFTGITWEMADPPEIEEELQKYDALSLRQFPGREAYSYMLYLRHHGFPSPLLDWTRSPVIAAFFAFRSISRPAEGKVSIYVFSETPQGMKATSSQSPSIRRMGPYIRSHRRHFLQQSDYTMCAIFERVHSNLYEWRFAGHEEATRGSGSFPPLQQDVIWKFDMPWDERPEVLRKLDSYNLNEFSLFESAESLMETLAVREFECGVASNPR